jgi:hypothetical protein
MLACIPMKLFRLVIKKTLFISVPLLGSILFAVVVFFIETERYGGDEVSFFFYIALIPTVIAYFALENNLHILQKERFKQAFVYVISYFYSSPNSVSVDSSSSPARNVV